MENYYKILEVDKEASPEIIEKAYKTLVKKYHPDVQTDEKKIIAEEKIKKINEAYDILSDETKRQDYDNQLLDNTISLEQYQSVLNENNQLKKQLLYVAEQLKSINNSQPKYTVNPNTQNTFTNNTFYQQPKTKKNHQLLIKILKLCLIPLFIGLILFILSRIPYFSFIFNPNIILITIIIVILLLGSNR